MAWDVSAHPARWAGPQLAGSTDWVHRFTADEIDELCGVARRCVAEGVGIEALVSAPPALPVLAPVLADWRAALVAGRGFVLARGLPVDLIDPAEVEAAYLVLGVHLGVPVPQNSAGELLGHVRDDGSDPDDPKVRRYRTRLAQPFHVDGSDLVGLLCLQQGKSGGLSQIVSSVTVYDEIARRRPDLEPLLHERWCFDTYGQTVPDTSQPWFEAPLLTGGPDRFSMTYLRWYIDRARDHPGVPRLSATHVELLDLIDALAADPALHLDMAFEPGDVQLLSNRTILHSRTAYEDFDEPARRRHLLRLWLRTPS